MSDQFWPIRPFVEGSSRPKADAYRRLLSTQAVVESSLNTGPKQPDLLQSEQRLWQLFSSLALSDAGETPFYELKLLVELHRTLFYSVQGPQVLFLHLF